MQKAFFWALRRLVFSLRLVEKKQTQINTHDFCVTTCLNTICHCIISCVCGPPGVKVVWINVKVLVNQKRKCLMTVTLPTDNSHEHVLMSYYQLLITGGTLQNCTPDFPLGDIFLAITYKNTRPEANWSFFLWLMNAVWTVLTRNARACRFPRRCRGLENSRLVRERSCNMRFPVAEQSYRKQTTVTSRFLMTRRKAVYEKYSNLLWKSCSAYKA